MFEDAGSRTELFLVLVNSAEPNDPLRKESFAATFNRLEVRSDTTAFLLGSVVWLLICFLFLFVSQQLASQTDEEIAFQKSKFL